MIDCDDRSLKKDENMKLYRFVVIFAALFLFLSPMSFSQLEQIRVACIGNSITQGSSETWPHAAGVILGSHYNVKNYGVGGTTLLKKGDFPYWTYSQFYEAQDFNPHIIFISLGTNDSKPQNWTHGREFYNDYINFVHTFRQNGRKPQIYVCYPPPAWIDNFGITDSIIHDQIIPLIDSVRRVENLLLIDWNQLMDTMASYSDDGIHPVRAYGIMGRWAADSILNSPAGFTRTFNASPQKYEQGDSVKLWWETSKGSQVTINGVAVKETDSMIVYPLGTVPYTLIAHGPLFSDTSIVTLEYIPPGTVKSLNANPKVLEKDAGDSTLIQWTTSTGSTVKFENVSVPMNSSIYVKPTSTTTFTLIANGEVIDTERIIVPVMDAERINRAVGNPAVSSTLTYGYPASYVADGDTGTEWMSSSVLTNQWIYVNMGKTRSIDRVVLRWGTRYATSYIIQSISSTGKITNLYNTTAGDGGIDDVRDLHGTGQLVRLTLNARNAADSGYALKEFEIYTPARSTGIQEQNNSLPRQYTLFQNYPNPFNPKTVIEYSLPARSRVNIKIFDLLGRQIEELVNSEMEPGNYEVGWIPKISSGIYFYRMESTPTNKSIASFIQTRMMVYLK
jgi:hypothetical protein